MVRFHISSAFSLLLFPNKPRTYRRTPPDVYSLSCKYYIEAIIIINEHNHPKSGGISFTASLRSIPCVLAWKGKGKRRRRKTVSHQTPTLTKNKSHVLPGGWSAISLFWRPFFLPKNRIYKVQSCQDRSLIFLCPQACKDVSGRTPAHHPTAKPASLLVVSCKLGEKSSNRLLDSSFTLFFSVSADGPLQCGHLLPFCFSTTEATNLCSPQDTPGAQTSLAQRASCFKNKRNWLSTFKNRKAAHKNPDCQLLNKRERKKRLAATLGLHTCCLLSGLRRTGAVFSKWDKPV